jgi:hypothetical protein
LPMFPKWSAHVYRATRMPPDSPPLARRGP